MKWQNEFLEAGTKKLNIDCSALIGTVTQILDQQRKEIVENIKNAGENSISRRGIVECDVCQQGDTRTVWISQNDIINNIK